MYVCMCVCVYIYHILKVFEVLKPSHSDIRALLQL